MKRDEFLKFVEAFVALRKKVDDETALTMIHIFPTLKGEGKLIEAGTRINYYGDMYRARADLWDLPENIPTMAPDLWELVTSRKEVNE